MTTVHQAKSAKCVGYGTDKYKRVIGLSDADKAALKRGELVYLTGARPAQGKTGTTIRVVRWHGAKDDKVLAKDCHRRVPTSAELAVIAKARR